MSSAPPVKKVIGVTRSLTRSASRLRFEPHDRDRVVAPGRDREPLVVELQRPRASVALDRERARFQLSGARHHEAGAFGEEARQLGLEEVGRVDGNDVGSRARADVDRGHLASLPRSTRGQSRRSASRSSASGSGRVGPGTSTTTSCSVAVPLERDGVVVADGEPFVASEHRARRRRAAS